MNAERTWVLQARQGNQRAFAKLVEAYQGPVYNLAYRMLGNAGDAEDAAQETFLRAYSHLGSYDPKRKFSSWLLAIASNYCIDQLRRRRINWVSVEELPPWQPLRAQTPDPEQSAIRWSDGEQIQAMLDTLPPDYRLAVVLRYWYDYSYQDIAAVTNSHGQCGKVAVAIAHGGCWPRRWKEHRIWSGQNLRALEIHLPGKES